MHIGNGKMPMKTRFWMVYGEGQGAPTYKHDSKQSAEEEAQRLALCHPGIAFYALKATSIAFAASPAVSVAKLGRRQPVSGDDGIPF
jgi:hypothetical protein